MCLIGHGFGDYWNVNKRNISILKATTLVILGLLKIQQIHRQDGLQFLLDHNSFQNEISHRSGYVWTMVMDM